MLMYAFGGQQLPSPTLLSAGSLVSRAAFVVALPVIFISESINGTVVGRYIHGAYMRSLWRDTSNTKPGWISWVVVISIVTLLV